MTFAMTKRLLPLGVAALMLSACSGGGSTGNNPGLVGTQCSPGTQVALASPTQGQTGVSTTVGQVVIVGNGNNNYLYQTYTNFEVVLQDNFGNTLTGSTFNLVTNKSYPQPYSSNFYYGSNVTTLNAGATYNVYLNQLSLSCGLIPVGSFNT